MQAQKFKGNRSPQSIAMTETVPLLMYKKPVSLSLSIKSFIYERSTQTQACRLRRRGGGPHLVYRGQGFFPDQGHPQGRAAGRHPTPAPTTQQYPRQDLITTQPSPPTESQAEGAQVHQGRPPAIVPSPEGGNHPPSPPLAHSLAQKEGGTSEDQEGRVLPS